MSNDKAAIGIALAAALGVGLTVGALASGDDERDVKPENVIRDAGTDEDAPSRKPARARPPHAVDTAAYAEVVTQLRAKCSGACTDLLSPPVEPGQSVTTGVMLERGARFVDVALVGPADGAFSPPSWTCEDRDDATWCEITATNTSATTLRLTAMVEYEVK